MPKHTLAGGNGRELLDLLVRLKTRAEQRIATAVKVVAIQEVGLDGFWIHRLLEANRVESHVVDPRISESLAVSGKEDRVILPALPVTTFHSPASATVFGILTMSLTLTHSLYHRRLFCHCRIFGAAVRLSMLTNWREPGPYEEMFEALSRRARRRSRRSWPRSRRIRNEPRAAPAELR
jgi:hypothetical protein